MYLQLIFQKVKNKKNRIKIFLNGFITIAYILVKNQEKINQQIFSSRIMTKSEQNPPKINQSHFV